MSQDDLAVLRAMSGGRIGRWGATGMGRLNRGLLVVDRLSVTAGLAVGVGIGGAVSAGMLWGMGGYALAGATLCGAAALALTGQPTFGLALAPRLLDLVKLPGGSFLIGSPDDEPGRFPDEGPRHEVAVSGFFLGRYPVTQGQYRKVMGQNPGQPQGDDLPVNSVSYLDAVAFCNALSQSEGLPPCYRIDRRAGQDGQGEGQVDVTCDREAGGYRLPTEAEWEYAARGGTTTAFSCDAAALGDYAWYEDNSNGQPHPVGGKQANVFGLHDMHGNVWEWCEDWYQADAYAKRQQDDKPVVNPLTTDSSSGLRVLRGGSFVVEPGSLRSAVRFGNEPEVGIWNFGFRCVWSPVRQPGALVP